MSDNTTIGSRFKEVRNNSGLSQKAFADAIGVSRSLVAMIERNDTKPNLDILTTLVSMFDTTYDFIIEGKRNLHKKSGDEGKEKGKVDGQVDHTYGKRNLHKIEELQITSEAVVEYVDKNDNKLVPITDIKAAAGYGVINTNNLSSEDFIHVPSKFLKGGNHICIQVRGESMAPTFLDGSFIIIRHIEPSEWRFIPDNYVYVVSDKEGMAYVKRVKNRFTEHGFITLMSDNIDKANYPNFNIYENEIQSLWVFELSLSFKCPNINDNYYSKVSRLEEGMEQIVRELDYLKKNLPNKR